MKRELFQNITAIPYTSGDAIDREGFLSAVIGANVASEAEVTVKVEHSDDGETFVPVTDELVFPETNAISPSNTCFSWLLSWVTAPPNPCKEGASCRGITTAS